MNLARRHILGAIATRATMVHALNASAFVQMTPLPNDWYEIAVKTDRANLLPVANGRTCIDPDAQSKGARA